MSPLEFVLCLFAIAFLAGLVGSLVGLGGGIVIVPALTLLLALLLNQRVRGLAIFRTIFYLPSVASGVAVAVLFLWIFNPPFGLVNSLLSYVGIQGPGWLASTQWALPTLILMSLWSVGGTMIIFLAGLQNVPAELLEAASLDGAGTWQRFRFVTLPLLTPTILFNLVLLIINQFQTFTQAYTMTNGGPAKSTKRRARCPSCSATRDASSATTRSASTIASTT